ncbi:MAG: O-antigen ligase family protein [Anaerolineae bacterium]|jgi:O-antigen ligase
MPSFVELSQQGVGARVPDRRALLALIAVAAVALAIALLPLSWAVLLVAGGIVFIVTLVRPQFGVLLIVPLIPFGSVRQVRLGAMNIGATELLVALVLAAWLMRMVARREVRVTWPPLTLPLAVFIGVLLLSTLGAASLPYSLKELLKWLEVLALYVLVANEMRGGWTVALVAVVLGTGALAALQGIYQFLFQVGPEGFVLFGRFMRAYGMFEQPNPYAGYLGLTLPVALGLIGAAIVPVGKRPGGRWLVWAVGCGSLMFVAMIMSWSRGAWLGLAAAIAVMLLAIVARSSRAALLGLVFVVLGGYLLLAGGVALIPPSIVQRFADFVPYVGVIDVRGVEITDANFAVLERMAHWQSALAMWTDNPWLGVGIGNYEPVYPRYALPLWPYALGHAHNYYLNIAAETGVLGLISYLVLWATALLYAWRSARKASGWYWGVALGVLGVLVHLTVHNLVDNLYVHSMYLQVAMLLAIRTADARDGVPQQWFLHRHREP